MVEDIDLRNENGELHFVTIEDDDTETPASIGNIDSLTTSAAYVETAEVDSYSGLTVAGSQIGTVPYYLKEDFGDSELTDRPNTVIGAYLDFEGEVDSIPLGRYRPTWAVENDRPGGADGEDGRMVTESNSHVSTPSQFSIGAWSIDFRVPENSSFYFTLIANEEFGFDDSIEVRFNGSGNVALEKRVDYSGSTDAVSEMISSSAEYADAERHTVKVTREITQSGDARWELFFDGASLGTAVDEFLPEPNYFRVRNLSSGGLVEVHGVELGSRLTPSGTPDDIAAATVDARERLNIPVVDEDPTDAEVGDIWLRSDLE